VTDVGHLTDDADQGEDKMEKGSKREGKTAWEIADFYTQAFLHDMQDLNILPPNTLCKATDNIPEQIQMVQTLIDKGVTYETSDGIYFDTTKLPDYGKLANLQAQDLQAGARIDMGEKHNPHDFALWKFSPVKGKRAMEWESPWGTGFPGWHLECSAMATKYLGQPFDIHCGGIDHIPVHHTNEIAQSEAAADKPLARYWLHGEFLLIQDAKMAKSGDNFITLERVREEKISPLAYRFFVLQAHYRKQLTFSWEALHGAENGLERLYQHFAALPLTDGSDDVSFNSEFLNLLNDDLNTAQALALLIEKMKKKTISQKSVLVADQILGLDFEHHSTPETEIILPEDIQHLIKQRDLARGAKNWAESDRLRQQLENLDFQVEDTKTGTRVLPKKS
jgi:cysteinyl-tRNA synthetase